MTLAQVAESAGVSISTVSRVINGFEWVKPETAQRVKEAVRAVNYVPPSGRRSHRRAAAETARAQIGMLLIDPWTGLWEYPIYGRTIAAITEAVQARGSRLIMHVETNLQRIPEVVAEQGWDGVVALVGPGRETVLEEVGRQLPLVWVLGEGETLPRVDHVGPDNQAMGYLAARYLQQRGCQHVAYLTEKPQMAVMQRRAMAFQQASRQMGMSVQVFLPTTDPLIVAGYGPDPSTAATMEQMVDNLLAAKPRPQGVFIPADGQVAQVHAVLSERGGRLADEFALVSCDHELKLLTAIRPQPASIDPDAAAIGRLAVDQLFRRIADPQQVPVSLQVYPTLAELDASAADDMQSNTDGAS